MSALRLGIDQPSSHGIIQQIKSAKQNMIFGELDSGIRWKLTK
jgi:hypothetical protein